MDQNVSKSDIQMDWRKTATLSLTLFGPFGFIAGMMLANQYVGLLPTLGRLGVGILLFTVPPGLTIYAMYRSSTRVQAFACVWYSCIWIGGALMSHLMVSPEWGPSVSKQSAEPLLLASGISFFVIFVLIALLVSQRSEDNTPGDSGGATPEEKVLSEDEYDNFEPHPNHDRRTSGHVAIVP